VQSPTVIRILVQRGIWRWVEGLAKSVNIFTNLRNLQRGTGFDPESETAVVLTDSMCSQCYFVHLHLPIKCIPR